MNVLAMDFGETHVKLLVMGYCHVESGRDLQPVRDVVVGGFVKITKVDYKRMENANGRFDQQL